MKTISSLKWETLPKKITKQLKGGDNTLPDWDIIFSPTFPCPLPPGGNGGD